PPPAPGPAGAAAEQAALTAGALAQAPTQLARGAAGPGAAGRPAGAARSGATERLAETADPATALAWATGLTDAAPFVETTPSTGGTAATAAAERFADATDSAPVAHAP